jgi:hypothetical protein
MRGCHGYCSIRADRQPALRAIKIDARKSFRGVALKFFRSRETAGCQPAPE